MTQLVHSGEVNYCVLTMCFRMTVHRTGTKKMQWPGQSLILRDGYKYNHSSKKSQDFNGNACTTSSPRTPLSSFHTWCGILLPSLDMTCLHASGCSVPEPARNWELLKSLKFKTHRKILGRGTALSTEWVDPSQLERFSSPGVSSHNAVISCLGRGGSNCWICSGLSLLVFELSMRVALVVFVPFSWLSKCHREIITSNHA